MLKTDFQINYRYNLSNFFKTCFCGLKTFKMKFPLAGSNTTASPVPSTAKIISGWYFTMKTKKLNSLAYTAFLKSKLVF